ncbi:uncharacterized protein [Periplaneta americana]|uniref:uncharacterized protein isoform X2 n=1 Tax=Periplaneta americana TaxID=6978 RepID=UPI0037E7B6E5
MDAVAMHYTTGALSSHSVTVQFQTVQWEDHFNHLVTTLKDFTLLNILTDTTFVTGNVKVSVHRVIISCYSSYFKDLLTNGILNYCVLISDTEESLLQILINYIYTGVTSVPISCLNELYRTAKLLRLDGLIEAGRNHCFEEMSYFTWPRHQEMILQYLWQSRSDPSECDVILVTNNFSQTFAHSCVLGACSRHLLNIFLRHHERNKKKPYVLVLQNVKSDDLEAVLEFCYRGSVAIFEDNVSSVYDVAELLGVQNLCSKLVSINPVIEKMSEVHAAKYASDVVSRIKTTHCFSQTSDHSFQLQNIFQQFLNYEDFVDITLMKDKQSFTAHIVVLSAFSAYFKNLAKCLQHNLKDAFVLVKDLRSQHVRAFLDYVYKGEAEFAGTTEVFCGVMSDWIDFSLLSISESETCQILTNATSLLKQNADLEKPIEEQNVYHPNYMCQNIQEQQHEQKDEQLYQEVIASENTQQKENITVVQKSTNIENVTELEISPTQTSEILSKMDDVEDRTTSPEDNYVEDENREELETEEEEISENKTRKRLKDKEAVLMCYTCNGTFESRKQLREHLVFHPAGRIMKCSYCGKGFDRPSQMKLHIRIHTGSKPFVCKLCGRAFAAKSALRKHIDIHTEDKGKMFQCAVCSKSFSRKEYLEEHIRTHTGNKPFECPVCHKTFVGRTGLNHHKKTHADDDEKKDSMCEICGKSFTRHALWTHVKSHEKTHCCHHCNKCFSTASALRVHITGTHLGCRSYQCEICGKGFIQKNHLIRHMKVHDNSKDMKNTKPFLCGKCPRTFKTENKLESHTKIEHQEPGERPYSCEICNKRFAGRSTVIYHRRAHTGERPHRCSTCGKSFMRPDALRQHLTSHTGERPHQCSVCSRKFTTRSTLNKHVLSHKGSAEVLLEKQGNLSCDVCHKVFQSESQLSVHARVHNGSRPLRCHVCHKTFRYQDSLTKHLHIHNTHVNREENPDNDLSCIYALQVCGQTFESVGDLEGHTKVINQHNFTSENIIHNSDKNIIVDSLQQYNLPTSSVNSSICARDVTKVPIRRPYSITIDGNLCCNTDDQPPGIVADDGNLNSSTNLPPPPPPPPPPPLPVTLHTLSHPHQGLDIHSVISLASSRTNESEAHTHIEIVGNPTTSASYIEPLSKSFLFIDDSNHLAQENNKQKLNR